MNRLWVYQDQDGLHTITDEEILATYLPWWQEQMQRAGKEGKPEWRVADFVTVHWAFEAGSMDGW